MAGEIIRMGDKTSHGGTVLEGSQFHICMGKPIACIGHQVLCPKCKGIFPIVEGAVTATFYGKGVALAGMKTACGAVLIASQFTATVEYGGAGSSTGGGTKEVPSFPAATIGAEVGDNTPRPVDPHTAGFDDKFVLLDEETGLPLSHLEYAIRRESGDMEFGTTDAQGHTHLLSATASAEVIDIYV